MVNSTTAQGGVQHTNTLSLYKLDSVEKKDLAPYVPEGFSSQEF